MSRACELTSPESVPPCPSLSSGDVPPGGRPTRSLPATPQHSTARPTHRRRAAGGPRRGGPRRVRRPWSAGTRTGCGRSPCGVMRNPDDAADALQDAYIAAFRRAGSFRGDAEVTTWLHRVVVNACLDRLRSLKVRAADALPEDLDRSAELGVDAPADPVEAAEQRDQVARGPRPAQPRPAGRAGAGRHAGLLGRGGGDHPGLRAGHGEEPLRPRPGPLAPLLGSSRRGGRPP